MWNTLHDWVNKARNDLNQPDKLMSYRYFDLVVRLRNTPDTGYLRELHNTLDRAVKEASKYGPRLQRLLGDYYFQKQQFEQAAIEYNKVKILFEKNDHIPVAKLGLANTYDKMGETDRAKKLYRELSKKSSHPQIQKEAKQWLNNNG
ncbi:MAG: tol-pal system YbgF family protein [bacterium]